jgi:5-methyltetrahydrofolate--homocysteine methyltransferase
MEPHLRALDSLADCRIHCYPNAGLPDELGQYKETPKMMADVLAGYARNGWLNLVGGCCGSTPEHIAAIAQAVRGIAPRGEKKFAPALHLSGLEPFNLVGEKAPFMLIGERTNVAGSINFKKLVQQGKFDEALGVARQQVEGGANVIDINFDDGLLDGVACMKRFLNLIAGEPDIARVPLMIDSSKWEVIEAGLGCVQGKGIVNSISLKAGEAEFARHAKQVLRYGAALVVMAFDEAGQAATRDDKVRICRRAYEILTQKVGFPAEDIIFDANVLSVGTGMEEHERYALDFIEALPLIKAQCPGCRTSGGISNVSFAFRGNNAVREAMHSVFLYHAIKAGLDMGIVNAGMLAVYEDIDPVLRELVEDVILARRKDARSAHRACTEDQDWRRGGVCGQGRAGRQARMAQRGLCKTHRARVGQGRDGLCRRRRRGGQAGSRFLARRHRGASDGRHEGRRSTLWRGQDVPPAGGQERPRDEEGRGLSYAIHECRKKRIRICNFERWQVRYCYGQGRRARHWQEHSRRSPVL